MTDVESTNIPMTSNRIRRSSRKQVTSQFFSSTLRCDAGINRLEGLIKAEVFCPAFPHQTAFVQGSHERLAVIVPALKQPPFTQKAMFGYNAANGPSIGLELLTKSWSVFMVNQSSELAPPLARVKRISYTAVPESMLLRPSRTDEQERKYVMKLERAAEVYRVYHKMNSGKKYDRVLWSHAQQVL